MKLRIKQTVIKRPQPVRPTWSFAYILVITVAQEMSCVALYMYRIRFKSNKSYMFKGSAIMTFLVTLVKIFA